MTSRPKFPPPKKFTGRRSWIKKKKTVTSEVMIQLFKRLNPHCESNIEGFKTVLAMFAISFTGLFKVQ